MRFNKQNRIKEDCNAATGLMIKRGVLSVPVRPGQLWSSPLEPGCFCIRPTYSGSQQGLKTGVCCPPNTEHTSGAGSFISVRKRKWQLAQRGGYCCCPLGLRHGQRWARVQGFAADF